MRLPDEEHTQRPWRIHGIAPDFRLDDVWALPTPGGRDEFGLLVEGFARASTAESPSRAARALWALRWKLGALLGWDDEATTIGARVPSLRERLPADLQRAGAGPAFRELPFEPLYLLEDEWAAEIANATMHGVLHLGWVEDPAADGGFRGQMAVLVKPNGLTGQAYMAAIRPFRHLVVYPPMIEQVRRTWARRAELQAA